MILLLLSLAVAQTTGQAAPNPGPVSPTEERFERCVDLATSNAAAAEAEAGQWQLAGGGFLAQQCLGLAYATEQRWSAAAAAFESAARAAEKAHDVRSAKYWAQGGNAWLAAGDAVKARAALDAAIAAGTLDPVQRGEAHLDRARAIVASGVAGGETDDARTEIDAALVDAPGDPLAWLLSATLARRSGDLPRAQKDIGEALARAADDPSVQLEAGNIAARAKDEASARSAWSKAAGMRPDNPAAKEAASLLKQFDTP